MAIKYAVASGLWSATSTWDGGVIPGPGDDVYADGYTVTIDINDITVSSLNNSQRSGGTDGGSFITTTNAPRIYTCDINASPTNSTICLTLGVNNSNVQTFIGNLTGGLGDAVYNSATAGYTTQITGNLTAGSNGRAFVGRSDRPHYLTVIGNIIGSTSRVAAAIATSYPNGAVTVIGNVFGNGISMGGVTFVTGNIDSSNIDTTAIIATVGLRVNGVITNGPNSVYSTSPKVYLELGGSLEFNIVEDVTGNIVSLRTPIAGGNYPIEDDVRTGAIYGSVSEFTGTCDIPSPSSVAVGVPVDNTVGTAIISITDMGALLASYNV